MFKRVTRKACSSGFASAKPFTGKQVKVERREPVVRVTGDRVAGDVEVTQKIVASIS